MIKGVHLTLAPFPDDVVTPTFKIKRSAYCRSFVWPKLTDSNLAAKKFKREIDAAYDEAESEPKVAAKL